MNYLKTAVLISIVLFLFSSCDKGPTSSCNTTPVEFNTLYQSLITSGHIDRVSIDTEIHEYTFTLSTNKNVCEIGYQSDADLASTAYEIEIVDNSTNTVIYSDLHVFSSSGTTSYVSPSTTINLQSGVSYTVKRIQTNWGDGISNTIGRIVRKDPMVFPYNNGIMTITSSNFYQNGGPLPNIAIPYIDLRFQ